MTSYREILVEDADLSTMSRNCLRNGGFYRMGEVEKATAAELLRIPNLGRKSMREIEDWFAGHGALCGERRSDAMRQLKAMTERAASLRQQAEQTERYIEELKERLG